MGRMGRAVADRARTFGMEIYYTSSRRLSSKLEHVAAFHPDARDLVRISQFLTLHGPGTKQKVRFLNAETIALLPPNAIVANAARGSLVVMMH
jgi:lactate dehydrogenase-like 2-hydroxyacid dehydrogenase